MIERLIPPVSDRDVRALGELLVDAVDSGAAVSFRCAADIGTRPGMVARNARRRDAAARLFSSPATLKASSARFKCILPGRPTSHIAQT
jgi:hypothetical protein